MAPKDKITYWGEKRKEVVKDCIPGGTDSGSILNCAGENKERQGL